jgi:molybdenum cofactor cytidylyltransferase
MTTAPIANPELLQSPRLAWGGILHFHLVATTLAANLEHRVSHAADCSSSRACYDDRVIAPIVLAAGESTRMGSPKALLGDGQGGRFITRLLHTLASAGFAHVTVVTGRVHAAIVEAVAGDLPRGLTVTFARNPDPSRGQLSSLLVGLDAAATPGVRAALVTLVDVPFVAAATVRAVVGAYEASRRPIVRPARGTQHGHPVIFDASLFPELHRADPAGGAKTVVHAHAADIVHVEVQDEGAFVDIDTRDEYETRVLSRRT